MPRQPRGKRQVIDRRILRATTRCGRHPAVLPGLAGQRSARLAWEDLDLDAGTAQIRRGASYTSSLGMVLGSTKTSGAEGVHHLAPDSVAHLRKRRAAQQLEREAMGTDWREHVYDGEKLSMVFTAVDGGLANRQAVTKEISRAAKIAGIDPEGLASHSGRRTVVTALYADGGLDLADVAPCRPLRSLNHRRVRPQSRPPPGRHSSSGRAAPRSDYLSLPPSASSRKGAREKTRIRLGSPMRGKLSSSPYYGARIMCAPRRKRQRARLPVLGGPWRSSRDVDLCACATVVGSG